MNAALESMLTDVRCLDEFLGTTEPKHKTDVLAIDYAPRWTPTPVLTKAEHYSISRKLDHISTDRLLEHPRLDVIDLARRTLDLFNRFVESLPPIEA